MNNSNNGNDNNNSFSEFLFAITFIAIVFGTLVCYINGLIDGKYEDLEELFNYFSNYSEVVEESSADDFLSAEPSHVPSEEASNKPSEKTSEEQSSKASKESSEEPSEDPSSKESSEKPSKESSKEQSEEQSEELSEEISEEVSLEIYQEIMQEFPEHTIAYALYDIRSGEIVTEYNTDTLFRTGCTIKAAYTFYLISEKDITKDWNNTVKILSDYDDLQGTSVIRNNVDNGLFTYGSKLSIRDLFELTATYSDNIAYRVLTLQYGTSGFNKFMKKLETNIGLGSQAIGGTIYTSASADDQMKVWKAIAEFFKTNSSEAKYFKKLLVSEDGYKYSNDVLGMSTASMAGWAEKTTTFNECYILEGKYIVVILTTTNKETPKGQNIDTKPLETIAVKLHKAWEAYQ